MQQRTFVIILAVLLLCLSAAVVSANDFGNAPQISGKKTPTPGGGGGGGSEPTATPRGKKKKKGTATPNPTATPPATATADPTTEPSATPDPTAEPSITPDPTAEPSITPDPTAEPSATPEPTAEPSITPDPTTSPTPEPSVTPQPSARLAAAPVVISGDLLAPLLGIAPDDLVAFRYDGDWQPVPVQVDERVERDWGIVRGNGGPVGIRDLFYADAQTYVGRDNDPLIDANDEIVFMSDAVGQLAPPLQAPAGVTSVGVPLRVHDPLNAADGYLYLFSQDEAAPLPPLVDYSFIPKLASGDGKDGLDNWKEDSWITSTYKLHFDDEWVVDRLLVNDVDLLDRHKTRFALGYCARSEETFSVEAVFLANKAGPVRVLRSVMGANSGVYTQRDTFLYADRQETVTYLRVHEIPAITDYFDYSAGAIGMSYHNNLLPAGVIIDGIPDVVPQGMLTWELVAGADDSIVTVHSYDSSVPAMNFSSIYVDDATPDFATCTGDSRAYGMSGPQLHPVACTDPMRCSQPAHLTHHRTVLFAADQLDASAAAEQYDQVQTPIEVSVQP